MRWTFDKRSSKCVSIEKSATLGRSHDTVLVGSGKDTIQILGGVVGSVEHMWVAVPLALPTGDIPAFVGPELIDGLVDTARFHQPKIVLTSPNMIAAELPPHSDGSERVVINFFNVAQRDCSVSSRWRRPRVSIRSMQLWSPTRNTAAKTQPDSSSKTLSRLAVARPSPASD